jgi:hypothetical protein
MFPQEDKNTLEETRAITNELARKARVENTDGLGERRAQAIEDEMSHLEKSNGAPPFVTALVFLKVYWSLWGSVCYLMCHGPTKRVVSMTWKKVMCLCLISWPLGRCSCQ